ncbi:MAG: 2-hydroxy-6-oxo-2,4-heptadienoate hydrolase [Pelagibacteraceae bacterium]|nr:2-hydroxy-6-oxo-2,4-heptadienoate hydrolase [Pelagibacteraceae bacterium]|tara:strand:+ start:20712 stop:21266 length:555 start_codon:yes stop_codon:yes gene_type:complete
MKKISLIFIFIPILYFSTAFADQRETELNKLFNQLKIIDDSILAMKIEMKIWSIWTTHPSQKDLTELMMSGSVFMSENKLEKAYYIFSEIIKIDPIWAEAWNKRATVLYLLGKYQESQNDIDQVLKLENRHFGALSGQGLVQTELGNYFRAINSYKDVQKIYPSMNAPKIMIPLLEELIDREFI